MAETWFTPKEWKARLVEFAGRRLLRNVANGESTTYDVSRSEGQVSQEGDAFNTKNMNDLEQRIADGFAKAKTNIDSLNDNGAIKGMDAREDGVYITYSTGADTVTKKLGSSGIGGTLETVAVRDRTVMTRNYIFNNTGDYVSLVLNVKTPPNGGNANSVTVYGTAIGTSTYKQIQKITTLNADVTVNIKGYDHIKLAVTASHSGNVGQSYEATTITTYALS
jgi:hypothetical protein